jgi:Rrf2 family transcriptional regulator, iron-sulfur cluster assembly transcription factor
MFKINRKTEYALRGLRYLANKRKDEVVMIREIAKAVDASPTFLAKIFQLLNAAGLLTSSRGVIGGFRLSRPAEKITLREVLEATEGPISVNLCVVDEEACDLSKTCAAHKVWDRLKQMLDKELGHITLKDI